MAKSYSLYCREGVFSETGVPVDAVLGNLLSILGNLLSKLGIAKQLHVALDEELGVVVSPVGSRCP
jgi:hypothetical protein